MMTETEVLKTDVARQSVVAIDRRATGSVLGAISHRGCDHSRAPRPAVAGYHETPSPMP
jgi:hypothetical protein